MGGGVSVSSDELSSPALNQAKNYFRNCAMIRGFWNPIEKVKERSGPPSVTLAAVHKFLSSTSPEFSVALYTGPFLGPFATSKFCLKQAYYSSLPFSSGSSQDSGPSSPPHLFLTDLNEMILEESQLSQFLKFLFFYHRLYSLFGGDTIRYDLPISYLRFQEIYEDLNDENISEETLRQKFAQLQNRASSASAHLSSSSRPSSPTPLSSSMPLPTYKDFVIHMSEIVFNDRDMFSRAQGEAILDKQEETLNQLVGRMRSYPPPPIPLANSSASSPSPPLIRGGSGIGLVRELSGEEHERMAALELKLRKRGSVYVLWHNVASSEEWLGAIQSLSLPHFSAMFEQIKCQRCSFAQSLHDSSIFITILWLNDNGGTLFELFMKEQLSPGGVYFQAAEDELICGPYDSLQFINESHVGWESEILPNDILNMVSFKTRSYPKFSRAYMEYQSKTARDNGHMLQSFYGPQMTSSSAVEDAPGILEHYTADGWRSGGKRASKEMINDPPSSYRITTEVTGVPCRVLASFEHSNWLRKR